MSCGAKDDANQLMTDLTTDLNIELPVLDLSKYEIPPEILEMKIKPVTLDDLTSGQVDGNGAFDKIMRSMAAHLKEQFNAQRITGAEYAKVYIAMVESALGQATQFLLQKDLQFWQAQNAQIAAITAGVQLATAKTQFAIAKIEAMNQKANYAVAKMSLANADIQYCINKFNLEQMLPDQLLTSQAQRNMVETQITHTMAQTQMVETQRAGQLIENDTLTYNLSQMLPQQRLQLVQQTALVTAQTAHTTAETGLTGSQKLSVEADTSLKTYDRTSMRPAQLADVQAETAIKVFNEQFLMPAQKSLIEKQVAGAELQNNTAEFNLSSTLPAQLVVIQRQQDLVKEQFEVQRAQTMETRSDGVVILGAIGKQKALHDQQVKSYQNDTDIKVTKVFTDAWTVMKSVDDGILPPGSFTNANIDQVINLLRNHTGMV